MDPQKSKKISKSNSRPSSKRLISKAKKLTIDIPEETASSPLLESNKNSPKFLQALTPSKKKLKTKQSISRISTQLAKKVYSPTSKSKIFQFPQETPKSTFRVSPKQGSPIPFRKSTNPKPKTPMQKKNKPKLIKRPKTSTHPKPIVNEDPGGSPNIQVYVTRVSATSKKNQEEIYNEHLFQTFQALKIVKTLPPVDLEQLRSKRIEVPIKTGYENRKTVVFDLDETLVHCCENIEEMNPDVILPITFPTGEIINAGINIRPYALECLKELNKSFEVFVFTASHQCYANVVLDYLDPTGELIHARFFRENCINMNGIYIKDLRIFANRKLNDMVIIDNAAYSFAYQIDNGVPIISWHDDREDNQLLNLTDYLHSLVDVEDIREVNFETFHLRTFYEDYMHEFFIGSENAK